jgi:hypothetical protein
MAMDERYNQTWTPRLPDEERHYRHLYEPLSSDTNDELHARLKQIDRDRANVRYVLDRLGNEQDLIVGELLRRGVRV